jgi:hypothetical protein
LKCPEVVLTYFLFVCVFSSSESFSACKVLDVIVLYTPSSRHEHGVAFCKGLREDFLCTYLSLSGYSGYYRGSKGVPSTVQASNSTQGSI